MLLHDASWLFRSTDNLATLIYAGATLCGALAVLAGVWRAGDQLRLEAASRRRQEIERQIDRFHSPKAAAAIEILSNFDFDCELHDGKGLRRVCWSIVERALVPATLREHLYDPDEPAIRSCFTDLIHQLDRLEHLRRQGLIPDKDVRHVALGLAARIAGQSAPVFRNLRVFMRWYCSEAALSLFRRLGHDLESSAASDHSALVAAIAAGTYGPCTPTPWGR